MDDNRSRQSAEIVLVQSMYPSEFNWREREPDLKEPDCPDPVFSLALHPSYTLEISLPSSYPSEMKPNVYLSCSGDISTSRRKVARAALARQVEELESGVEVLDVLINAFVEHLPELTAEGSESEAESLSSTTASKPASGKTKGKGKGRGPPRIKRVVIWSHHLLATSKRRDILAWSKELALAGYSRPGYPGAVFAEGEEDQIDEFVRRLKQLRWQALQVRAEDVGEQRLCGPGEGVQEVEGLGEVSDGLKKRSQECTEMFLEGMKIAH